jgi:hypothetical protein
VRQRPEIDGEYPQVANLTTRYDELKLAHQTAITPGDARALADLLHPGVEVYFRGYRGHAHYGPPLPPPGLEHLFRSPVPDSISLPSPGWGNRNYGPAIGKLRVGIVLHELAHVQARCPGHGEDFVQGLDALLDLARGLW